MWTCFIIAPVCLLFIWPLGVLLIIVGLILALCRASQHKRKIPLNHENKLLMISMMALTLIASISLAGEDNKVKEREDEAVRLENYWLDKGIDVRVKLEPDNRFTVHPEWYNQRGKKFSSERWVVIDEKLIGEKPQYYIRDKSGKMYLKTQDEAKKLADELNSKEKDRKTILIFRKLYPERVRLNEIQKSEKFCERMKELGFKKICVEGIERWCFELK